MSADQPVHVRLIYLSERDIEPDAQNLIAAEVRERLENAEATVLLERVETSTGPLKFARNQAQVTELDQPVLDRVGETLREQPVLRLEISAGSDKGEREGIADERAQAIKEYLMTNYLVAPERMTFAPLTESGRETMLVVKMNEGRTAG